MGTHAQDQSHPTTIHETRHALVIGGSIAGLLAARVLTDHFDQVTIIDRDIFPDMPEHRKGAPQSYHTHGLSERGKVIINEFFPDIFDDLCAAGADTIHDKVAMVMVSSFGKLATFNARESIRFSHYLIEWQMRDRLLQRSDIKILSNCEVTELLATPDHARIVGVKMRDRGLAGQMTTLTADFVVDASGRNSKTPQWLTALGYEAPLVDSVNSGLGYASRFYEKPANFPDAWQGVFILPRPQQNPRAGTIAMIENNVWHVTLSGVAGHYPPTNEEGFVQWARDLPDPGFYASLRIARPLTPIRGYRVLENHFRRYERLQRWPAGFIVLGDAVCALNPIRGQGMAASALAADTLATCLQQQQHVLTSAASGQYFQLHLSRALTDPWLFALGEDLRWPNVTYHGTRLPSGFSLWQRYLDLVLRSAVKDPEMSKAYLKVYGMMSRQSSLARPRILLRILNGILKRLLMPATPMTDDTFVLPATALAQLQAMPTANSEETAENPDQIQNAL
jgi:2-polyprenyl-6-methoxyphenol hydroxylase-like FAD-dependent oxidoreductase